MSSFDETFDFVIAGSGAGSMVAALTMRSKGYSVLILEKTGQIGGSTARSGGVMWIPNNPFMARDGVEDSFDKASSYLDALCGGQDDAPAATPERRYAFLTEAPAMLDFLISNGIDLDRPRYWPDYYDELPGGSAGGRTVVAKIFDARELGEWRDKLRPSSIKLPGDLAASIDEMRQLPLFKRSWKSRAVLLKVVVRGVFAKLLGRHYVSGGAALQGRMLQAALREGVDVRVNTPVSELIFENDAVTGLLCSKDEKSTRVAARLGVLVNAGGFAHNQRLRDKHQPGTKSSWSMAAPGDTGEMIEEMLAKGAAAAQMEEFIGFQATIPPGSDNQEGMSGVQSMTAAPHAILVDQSGARYMNEGGSYMAYCRGILDRHKTVPAIPSWAIFDNQYMSKYMLAGTMPGSEKPQHWYDDGYLKKAATIEQLASTIGADPATLAATVNRFNGFVANNLDEDFQRGARAYDNYLGDALRTESKTLGSIDQAPYFAIPVVPGDVGTFGGVLTDERARVLREDGSVIDGLYATGVATGSVMGRFYPGAGASIGPSFTWGYVAAKHAAESEATTA